MKHFFVQTFGCQMNVHDSRRIEEVLRANGYREATEPALADLLVVNTCSVRDKAEHKLMSLLGTFRPFKEANRDTVLAVAGCVAQQEGERLLRKAPFIDIVLGPDNIPELPELIQNVEQGSPPITRTVFDMDDPQFLRAKPHRDRPEVTAYVTVMKGCDERCTFCIVPYTRGAERYRPADEILGEIADLVEGGVREITLLGQTVNSWHEPGDWTAAMQTPSKMAASTSAFPALLRRIASEVPRLARLRYTSPHPRHVTPALVDAHADLGVLPAHVHLPVQSGSDVLLRRMARRYTAEDYVARTDALKRARPGLTLSTDFIVGFPGETEADFEQTLALVRRVGFVAAFGFKYSPRPYTPALKLGGEVPEDVKDERLSRLFSLVETQQQAHLRSLIGEPLEVLVEGRSPGDSGRYSGRSERNEIVHLVAPDGHDPTGELVRVTVDEAFRHSLSGVMEGAPRGAVGGPRKRLSVLDAGGAA